jgi:hypothetical protein
MKMVSMDLINSSNILFGEISALIEQSRRLIYSQAGSTTILLFWQIWSAHQRRNLTKQARRLWQADCVAARYTINRKIWKKLGCGGRESQIVKLDECVKEIA